MPLKVDKCRCKSYHRHLPSNELGFINMSVQVCYTKPATKLLDQLENISFVMDEVRTVLESLEILRKELSDEAYESLEETPVGNLLDSLADLEYEVQKAEK